MPVKPGLLPDILWITPGTYTWWTGTPVPQVVVWQDEVGGDGEETSGHHLTLICRRSPGNLSRNRGSALAKDAGECPRGRSRGGNPAVEALETLALQTRVCRKVFVLNHHVGFEANCAAVGDGRWVRLSDDWYRR